jgi:hypothetical protein
MKKQDVVRVFAIASVAAAGSMLAVQSGMAAAGGVGANADAIGSMGPVPKAQCSPGDHTESGLQGSTTPEERMSGDSTKDYNCNLELVGKYQGEGAYSQDGPTFYGDCAYYGTDNVTSLQQHHGVTVVDVSDPRHPQATAFLNDSPAMLRPHETLKANAARGILVAGEFNGPGFAVYDISQDCRHPILKSSIVLQGSAGHEGNFAPDGKTYYLTQNNRGLGGFLYPVDLTDPANAKGLPPWQFVPSPDNPTGDGRSHENWLNFDGFMPGLTEGTRLYAGQPGEFGNTGSSIGPDGLVIEDVSDYQFRRPNPKIRIISKLFWTDQGQAEEMLPITIKGHPYIVSSDEAGGAGGVGGWTAACARGASAFGYPMIIDVADEKNPRIISKLMLEVNDPANCEVLRNQTPPDIPGTAPGTNLPSDSGTTNYSGERCTPDRQRNTTMLACSYQNAQLRVFDVRDPYHPKEIAYWKSGAVGSLVQPGSGSWAQGSVRTVDKIAGYVRFYKRPPGQGASGNGAHGNGDGNANGNGRGPELEIWTVSDGNGLQVLRFSDGFKALHKDLLDEAGGDE